MKAREDLAKDSGKAEDTVMFAVEVMREVDITSAAGVSVVETRRRAEELGHKHLAGANRWHSPGRDEVGRAREEVC